MTGPLHLQPMGALPAPTAPARALLGEFASLVGGRASLEAQDRLCASRDRWVQGVLWNRAGFCGPLPDLVLWPESLDELARVTRRAAELGVPLTPYGGGTGANGAAVPVRGGIVVDLKRMKRILAIDPELLEVECEAGTNGEALERRLNRDGMTLGHFPDTAPAATVGGWLATRSGGWAAGRHGKIEDMVASLVAVDGRGEVVRAPRRPLPGWDLVPLLLGSEGCLATIASARLHALRLPETRAFQAWRFSSAREGLEAARAIVRAGLRPAAVRLVDPLESAAQADAIEAPIGRRGALRRRFDETVTVPLQRLAARAAALKPLRLNALGEYLRSSVLLLVFEGPAELCELEGEEAGRICQAGLADELGPEPARLWLERRDVPLFRAARLFDDGAFFDTLDLAATWDVALEVHRRVREAIVPLALVQARMSHAYPEGCGLEFSVVGLAASLEDAQARHEELWRRALAAARAAGAVASHTGGVGLLRLNALKGQLGDGVRVLSALKATFDPAGILNPGKLGG